MKKFISKTGLIKLLPAFIAVVFVLIALIGFVPKLVENAQNEKIARTGTRTFGYNLEYHAAHVIDNEQYFYITFNYLDGSGKKQSDKTSATYTELEAVKIVMSNSLKVTYTAKGAINSDFNREKADKFPRTMALVFAGIGVFLAGVSAVTVFRKKSAPTVLKHGVLGEGEVKGIVGGMHVGGKEYFLVRVTYQNQRGEVVNGNTEYDYEKDVYQTYRKGDRVAIKYYGTSVVILGKADGEGAESSADAYTKEEKAQVEDKAE